MKQPYYYFDTQTLVPLGEFDPDTEQLELGRAVNNAQASDPNYVWPASGGEWQEILKNMADVLGNAVVVFSPKRVQSMKAIGDLVEIRSAQQFVDDAINLYARCISASLIGKEIGIIDNTKGTYQEVIMPAFVSSHKDDEPLVEPRTTRPMEPAEAVTVVLLAALEGLPAWQRKQWLDKITGRYCPRCGSDEGKQCQCIHDPY